MKIPRHAGLLTDPGKCKFLVSSTALVQQQLTDLENQLAQKGDYNAYFLAMYRYSTTVLRDMETASLRSSHSAHCQYQNFDGDLVGALIRHMWRYYMVAWEAYSNNSNVTPRPWKIAFDYANKHQNPFICLVMGAVVHICLDLTLSCLDKSGDHTSVFLPCSVKHRKTFRQMNSELARDITGMCQNISELEANMYKNSGKPVCLLPRVNRILNERIRFYVARQFVAFLRKDAERSCVKIHRGSMSVDSLTTLVSERLKILDGGLPGIRFAAFLISLRFSPKWKNKVAGIR